MIYKALIKKELMENRWKYAVILIWLLAFGSTLFLSFKWLGDLLQSLTGLEAELTNKLMGAMMEDFALYAWANWYGKTFYQSLVLFAIILGMSNIAGEVGRGTASFVFTKPLSRREIFFTKYATGGLGLALVITVSTFAAWLASQFYGEALSLSFLTGIPMAFAGSLVIYSIAVYWSVVFDDQIKAGVAAALTAFVISIPGWFGSTAFLSVFVHMRGWPIYLGQDEWLMPLLAMLLISGAIYYLGLRALEKKEL
ncbi:ABC transporter permease [Desulfofalx alkaliphila]|uniref:ABC transporter permease n=1 Tax=Desulfofalx alkaliphila TaxID=105483 RepID=UPI0004E12BEE|nr:ABC transporter permease subunit [Desulfofalx alkaliphila]